MTACLLKRRPGSACITLCAGRSLEHSVRGRPAWNIPGSRTTRFRRIPHPYGQGIAQILGAYQFDNNIVLLQVLTTKDGDDDSHSHSQVYRPSLETKHCIDSATVAYDLRKPPEQCRSVQSLRICSLSSVCAFLRSGLILPGLSRDREHTICRLKAAVANTGNTLMDV
ncbi:hypothetical protein BKA64DRAFT_348501 [Cadophora sp. MPI-SDFR-AT-0126]|nr:hypothetical protein BKA64DRAFT_348501 [Leotiomycetes sp. MPI-SDFR-AT-0126]